MRQRFADRFEAGHAVAEALPPDLRENVVVVGLARGGVQTAAAVAGRIDAPLDVLAVRKVGHPLQPEYAIGAVAPGADGIFLRARDGLSDEQLERVVARAKQAADELDRRLHADHPQLDVAGRTVIVVDDGLATGATMVAAVRWAKARGATRVVAAVPVAAAVSARALRREAEVVCPNELADFGAVGFWYERFDQVDDAEVVALLGEVAAGEPTAPAGAGETPAPSRG